MGAAAREPGEQMRADDFPISVVELIQQAAWRFPERTALVLPDERLSYADLAIVAAFLLLVHYIIIFLNLRPALGGGGVALRFIGVGLLAYLLTGLVDAVTSIRGVAVATEFTLLDAAQAQIAAYGAATFILLGALYFAVPHPRPSLGFKRARDGPLGAVDRRTAGERDRAGRRRLDPKQGSCGRPHGLR